LRGVSYKTSFANTSNNFVLSYGCICSFAQFWLCFYGTPLHPPIPHWIFIQIQNLNFLCTFYRSIFLCIFHLSFGGPFNMVFEHLEKKIDFEDSMSGFLQLHRLCSHVIVNRILRSMAWVIGANWFLTLAKPSNGICSIIVGKNSINAWVRLYAYNFMMCLLFIDHHINLRWWL